MNALVAFILTTSISSAGHRIEASQAHPGQLLLKDPADVNPFLLGQWQMSARQEVLRIGGSSHLSHWSTGSKAPQYITVIWNLSPRNLGWLGGLSSVAMATPANLPCSRRFHRDSERHLSTPPSKSKRPLLIEGKPCDQIEVSMMPQ